MWTKNPDYLRLKKGLPQRIRVFITHSSHDSELATVIIHLVEKAFGIPSAQIRCTSVDRYRLPAGVNTDEQLRREVLECDVLVGVLTDESIGSLYVSFELGARWGAKKPMIPLLVGSPRFERLSGPLRNINVLTCKDLSQAREFVRQIGSYLKKEPPPEPEYKELLQRLVEASVSEIRGDVRSETRPVPESAPSSGSQESAPLDEADVSNSLSEWIENEFHGRDGPANIKFAEVAEYTGLPLEVVRDRLPKMLLAFGWVHVENIGRSSMRANRSPYAQ